jgi:hypothetical protein
MRLLPWPQCFRIVTRLYSMNHIIVRFQCIRNGSNFDTPLHYGLDYSVVVREVAANRTSLVVLTFELFCNMDLSIKACVVFGYQVTGFTAACNDTIICPMQRIGSTWGQKSFKKLKSLVIARSSSVFIERYKRKI